MAAIPAREYATALAGPVAEAWWRGEASVIDALTSWRADWQEIERALLVVPADERDASLRGWLADVRFEVELQPSETADHGSDQVRFLFSANPGQPLAPLAEVASGGEMSRFLLALKTTLARVDG